MGLGGRTWAGGIEDELSMVEVEAEFGAEFESKFWAESKETEGLWAGFLLGFTIISDPEK